MNDRKNNVPENRTKNSFSKSNATFARKYHNTYSFLLHPAFFRLYCLKKRGKGVVGGENCDPETGGEKEEEDEGGKRK